MVLATLRSFDEKLETENDFLRVHRSYIVNLKHVSSANRDKLTIGDEVIPIGETYQKSFLPYLDELKRIAI